MGISHFKNDTIADWTGTVTVGNTSGGTATVLATDLVRPSDWNSNHNISLGASDLTWVGPTEFFEPFIPAQTNSSLSAPGIGTWYIDPFVAPNGLNSGQIGALMQDAAGFLNGAVLSAATTGSISRYQTMNLQLALYEHVGTNTTAISTTWSADASYMATWTRGISSTATSQVQITNAITLSFPAQWDASGGVTYSSTAQSGTLSVGASTMVSSSMNSIITGALAYVTGSRMMVWPFNASFDPDEYWLGHMFSSTSSSNGTGYSTGTMFSTQSLFHNLEVVAQGFKRFGQSVSNTSTALQRFHGSVATVGSVPFATLATSDIRNLVTNARMYWNLAQRTF